MDDQQPSVNNGIFYQKPKEHYGFVYKYTSPSGKFYIGQTSNSLKERARNIFTGEGYKKCTVFWKAIQKYGWKNFLVEILDEVPLEELNDKEVYYIKYFNSLVPNGYNQTIGGETGKQKEVYVYSAQNGSFIEHYNSITQASENTGVPIETISAILSKNSHRKQAHNLTFLDEYVDKYDVKLLERKNYHHVYVYDKEGNYLTDFSTIREASKVLGIAEGSISKCFRGISLHASYYQFRDQKEDKINPIPRNSKSPIAVRQIDPNTKEIIMRYPSISAAARAVGLSNGDGIKKVISRNKGLSGGYFWEIDEGSTTMCS